MKKYIIVLFIIFAVSLSPVSAKEKDNTYDLLDILQTEEHYQNIDIIKYSSVKEYVKAVEEDCNLDSSTKAKIIASAMIESVSRSQDIGYLTFTFSTKVDSSYYVKPYFYTKVDYCGNNNPCKILSVENANIDRNYNSDSKQFSGDLYYNLEDFRTIYFDLNGDFYENGTTSIGSSASVGIGESTKVSFSISYATDFYKYVHDTQRKVFENIF